MKHEIDNCWNTIGTWSTEHSCEKLKEEVHCHNCDVFHQATSYIYGAPLTDEYRDECTEIFREKKRQEKVKEHSVLTFEIFGEWLAIPSCYIKEITTYRTVQRLPHNNNPFIQGVINISGEIEISFSLANILKIDSKSSHKKPYRHAIIAEYEGYHFVFPVNHLGEVYRYHGDDLQDVPSTLDEHARSFTHGIIKWKYQKVSALDAELLFSAISRSM